MQEVESTAGAREDRCATAHLYVFVLFPKDLVQMKAYTLRALLLQVPTAENPHGVLPRHGLWIVETRIPVRESMDDPDGNGENTAKAYLSRFKLCFEGQLIAADMPDEHAHNLLAVLGYHYEIYSTLLPEVTAFGCFPLLPCALAVNIILLLTKRLALP